MLCVARMILAYVFAVNIAVALLLMSRSKQMQESMRTRVNLTRFDFSNVVCIWIIHLLCSIYDIGTVFWCKLCDSLPFFHFWQKEKWKKL